MKTVLFVCSGNICRSPMAEGLLRRRLAADGRDGEFRVRSAGTWAMEGAPANASAVRVMAERGVNIGGHRTHELTAEDVESATLILTMTEVHAQALRRKWPQHSRKVYRLSEMAGQQLDVEDPYGAPLDVYRACADEIEALIEEGYERILELAGV
ncbi:MAG: low molecular weight protein arginine phosphatase [Anaerolineae bacterium]|nr:low molecular weight protein arginine phosphatase [Anaerolineae bacterium]